MATVTLNAQSKPYPSITNRLRAGVYAQGTPQALIVTQIRTAPHPTRMWNFPGLLRANYGFRLDEIDGSGNVIQNLADFAVVPGSADSLLTRDDEQIKVGTTPGLVNGTQSFTFDGTGGKPDYIGWEIVVDECTGRDIMVNGLDYTWNKATATFTLIQTGDFFRTGQYLNVHFNPIQQSAGNAVLTPYDFQVQVETVGRNLIANDFGNKLIVEPTADYIEFTLPDPATVPQGRRLMIETKQVLVTDIGYTGFFNIRIKPYGSEPIVFNRGSIYMSPGESIGIYLYSRASNQYEWRVDNTVGNFTTVGDMVSSDITVSRGITGKIPALGFALDKFKFAKLYNDYVLKLDPAYIVAFDSWSTGNNFAKFSLANSANSLYANLFRIPMTLATLEVATSYLTASGTIERDFIDVGTAKQLILRSTQKYILT